MNENIGVSSIVSQLNNAANNTVLKCSYEFIEGLWIIYSNFVKCYKTWKYVTPQSIDILVNSLF